MISLPISGILPGVIRGSPKIGDYIIWAEFIKPV